MDMPFGEGGSTRCCLKQILPFHPYSPRSIQGWQGVPKVFKEYDFGECTGREIYPKALTLPVDNLFLSESQ